MLLKPTIHLNGTSRADLLAGYRDAINAISGAMRCLAETLPNGRDYYPQSDEAILRAIEQHADRMEKLRSVVRDLEEIAGALDD